MVQSPEHTPVDPVTYPVAVCVRAPAAPPSQKGREIVPGTSEELSSSLGRYAVCARLMRRSREPVRLSARVYSNAPASHGVLATYCAAGCDGLVERCRRPAQSGSRPGLEEGPLNRPKRGSGEPRPPSDSQDPSVSMSELYVREGMRVCVRVRPHPYRAPTSLRRSHAAAHGPPNTLSLSLVSMERLTSLGVK